MIRAAIVFMTLTMPLSAASINLSGDLQWTGQPTSDGSATWPAELTIELGSDFSTQNVTLDSMPYSGAWMTSDDGMTSATSRFFTGTDVNIEVEMSPLSDLTAATLEDITNVRFQWAHPLFNEEAPVSFLTLEAVPSVVVPEPHAALIVGMLVAFLAVLTGLARR